MQPYQGLGRVRSHLYLTGCKSVLEMVSTLVSPNCLQSLIRTCTTLFMNKYMLHSGRLHSGVFIDFSFLYAPLWSLFNFSFIFLGLSLITFGFMRSFPTITFVHFSPRLFHNKRFIHLTRAYPVMMSRKYSNFSLARGFVTMSAAISSVPRYSS